MTGGRGGRGGGSKWCWRDGGGWERGPSIGEYLGKTAGTTLEAKTLLRRLKESISSLRSSL